MEILKQNETYKFTDTYEDWTIEGTLSKDIDESLNFYFNVNSLNENVGYCNYSIRDSKISMSYNIDEVNYSKFTTCIDSVIAKINQHFAE